MKKSIYVAASNQHVGKTTMTLGLLAALKDRGLDVGYCKPVGQQFLKVDEQRADKDAVLFACTMGFELIPDVHSPVILGPGDTAAFLENKHDTRLLDRVTRAAKTLQEQHEFVVYEGTGHPGVGSVVDLSNAVVAREISATVILLLEGGIGSTVDRLTLCESMFRNKGVKVAGIIINKVLPSKMKKVRRYLKQVIAQRGIELLGLIPYDEMLVYPNMHHVQKAVKGDCVKGEEYLGNVVHDTIAGASLRQDLGIDPSNQLLVVSRERFDDVINQLERVFLERKMGPHLAGLVITGQEALSAQQLKRVGHFKTPIIMTHYDTYDAVIHLGHLVAKIDTANPKKIERAIALFKEHVDVDRIVSLLNEPPPG